MERTAVRMLLIIHIFVVFSIELVMGDYCEFGICDDDDHYCCGRNKCCEKTLDQWYFWSGILLVVFALAVALGWRFTKCSKSKDTVDDSTFSDCKYKLLEHS